MSTYHKNHLLIQTFIELDSQISHLTNKISGDRFIELGEDPRLIQEIENILLHLETRLKSIESFFDLSITPLSKANIYFSLIRRIGETLKYIREVRRKDYGCQEHTYELLNKLEKCSQSIDAIGDLVSVNADIMH